MSRGVNKCIFIGTCGKDPETNYMPSGGAVTNMSIAVNETWKDKQTGAKQERTEWVNITFFGRLAEIAGEYLKKGSQVYIEGSLRTEKWQDKQGNDRYTTKIIASELQMLGGKGELSSLQQQSKANQAHQNQPANTDDFEPDELPPF